MNAGLQTMLSGNDEMLSEKEFQRISDAVYDHCRINLHDGKKELVRARMAKCMRLAGYDNPTAYMDWVLANPQGEEFTHLIDSLSTNLTSFFRESQHFDYLAQRHVPALLETKKKAGTNRIRAWSAGCSTGEEPYTLAMVTLEALQGGSWDLKILATDISTAVLRTAELGMYDKQRVEGVPPAIRNKYLIPNRIEGRAVFQAAPALRQVVAFRYLNLMEPWPFKGPFDFIFCRNVMIYFDKPTQQKLVERYWDCLASGGLLFTGHSESLTGITHKFRYVQPTIYART
jgi:chemotaxis protein methyltransferase CheR